ncbi:DNA methyltransferase, partial [Barnesiella intestinihominis]|uniref:DNA methyltransferase n=1 Tax=Barnesiella intestinihominis TaxID=487174 RepID=UPI003FD8B227
MHPTQKPVKLYAYLLEKLAKKGDKILDTHLGSGSSRIAAYKLGYDFYATEISTEYYCRQEERFRKECLGEYKTPIGTI